MSGFNSHFHWQSLMVETLPWATLFVEVLGTNSTYSFRITNRDWLPGFLRNNSGVLYEGVPWTKFYLQFSSISDNPWVHIVMGVNPWSLCIISDIRWSPVGIHYSPWYAVMWTKCEYALSSVIMYCHLLSWVVICYHELSPVIMHVCQITMLTHGHSMPLGVTSLNFLWLCT